LILFDRFTVIAGPCLLEEDALNLEVGHVLAKLSGEFDLPVIFKASFDKANRSRLNATRGPGLEKGLQQLARVRDATGLALLTDVHEPEQADRAARVVDVIQVPAFLSRQTDLVVAAGQTGKVVNIKKGQWMAPEDMAAAVDKARKAGATKVAVTERGTAFGYGDLIVDMRSFARIRAACNCSAIFDGTHSVQRSGWKAGSSGGDPEHIPALVRAAVAAGCDGLFLEVHPQPEAAPSDATNMLRLDRLPALLEEVLAIRQRIAAERTATHGTTTTVPG
jgi:2-dehydro-3-deoxyphosphooctonate aldolase (KDO 8-P synthase)